MKVLKAKLAPFARGWIVDLACQHSRRVATSKRPKTAECVYGCSDVCDQCDGSGRYFIDGVARKCICSEPQS